jgi:transposase InsO family protein
LFTIRGDSGHRFTTSNTRALDNVRRPFKGFAATLEQVARQRGYPQTIQVDNGTESHSKTLDQWTHRRGVQLVFIRPGRLEENGYIESFNEHLEHLRDECLHAHLFFGLDDARHKLEAWRVDYNTNRPHRSLGQMTPTEYVAARSELRSPTAPFEPSACGTTRGLQKAENLSR